MSDFKPGEGILSVQREVVRRTAPAQRVRNVENLRLHPLYAISSGTVPGLADRASAGFFKERDETPGSVYEKVPFPPNKIYKEAF